MSRRSVWTVESGSYSDYSVHAVFANEADARAHAAERNAAGNGYDGYDVVERPLLSKKPERVETHYYNMTPTGGITTWTHTDWDYDVDNDEPRLRVGSPQRVLASGRTAEAAKKAALDYLAMAAAHKEGLA